MQTRTLPGITALVAALAISFPSAAVQQRDGPSGRDRGQERSRTTAQPRTGPADKSAQRGRAPERRSRPPTRGTMGSAVPRAQDGAVPRAVPRRPAGPVRGWAYPEPRVYGYARPYLTVPVIIYPRSYYVFRPRFWIGYGLYIGILVPYPVAFGYPTYVYGYPAFPPNIPPAAGTYGGVSFDVTPSDASVSVDGVYIGVVADFSPTHQPLTLTLGRHHIELQAPDMIPIALDVDIVGGEVVPYRGSLQRQ